MFQFSSGLLLTAIALTVAFFFDRFPDIALLRLILGLLAAIAGLAGIDMIVCAFDSKGNSDE